MKSYLLMLGLCAVPLMATAFALSIDYSEPNIRLDVPPPSAVPVENIATSIGNIHLNEHQTTGSIIIIKKQKLDNNLYRYNAITAYHVIDNANEDETKLAEVCFRNGFHGQLLSEDVEFFVDVKLPVFDLAIIAFYSSMELHEVEIASKEEFKSIKPFEKIYAIGCDLGRGPVLRTGVIGATDMVMPGFINNKPKTKEYSEIPWVARPMSFFRPHMTIWPGASGGGIFNKDGKLIGIINALHGSWSGPVTHQCIALNLTDIKFLIEEQLKD